MIRCSKCKRFVKNVRYMLNEFTDHTSDVTAWCKHCHKRVEAEYDCYEDLVGYEQRNEKP